MVAMELSKIVMVTVNVIFMLFGLASLIVGIIFKVGWEDVRDAFVDESENYDINLQAAGDTLAYGAIILGAFIIIVSLLGCIGACCKVKFLLVIYAIIVMLLLIGEVVVVALVATKSDESDTEITEAMKETMRDYHENSNNSISKAFSAIFSTFECCGIKNYSYDFQLNVNKTYHPRGFIFAPERPSGYRQYYIIPVTCCKGFDYEAELTPQTFVDHDYCLKRPNSTNAYTTGCYTHIKDEIKDHRGILIGIGVTILVLEVLMIILAFVLCCSRDD